MSKANADIKYDPEFPFALVSIDGKVRARFAEYESASRYEREIVMGAVVDTTPKPKIPEDAEFVTWDNGSYLPQIAQRDSGPANLGWRYGAEEDYKWYSSETLSREIGDAEVTVLVRKEET